MYIYKPRFDVHKYRPAVPSDDTPDGGPLDNVSLEPYVPERKTQHPSVLHTCVPFRLTVLTTEPV